MRQIIWNNLDKTEREAYLTRPVFCDDVLVQQRVAAIIGDVRSRGDDAVAVYTQKFDQVALDGFFVMRTADDLDPAVCRAIDTAYQNIRRFHQQQGFRAYQVETVPGVACQRIVRPIERIGLYVPGGSAPLVSTTLMLGVPAQIAGCAQTTLCTPCDKDGRVNPYVLYAAKRCGMEQIYRVGGAQAIAAMAYGTQTIPKTDKIFGPGNVYVTEAKMQISRDPQGAAIDMPAGPSEVCVIADEATHAAFAAADLLSQAEHDALSQAVLISTSQEKASAITAALQKQLQILPRRDVAEAALKNSVSIVVQDVPQAIEVANRYAPEHLILCFEQAAQYLDHITHAGAVFLGEWTPEAAGDYASGTNHVLPTYGYARNYSGLGVEAFQKTITVQSITQTGLVEIGPAIGTLAMLEGLDAHARAIAVRLEGEKG